MTLWKSFGASVRGPAHIATGAPNQDAWASFHHAWGDGIVVSDGVGSKPFSNFGSDAACMAVGCAAMACHIRADIFNAEISRDFLFERIKDHWLSIISPLEPRDCSATCLFAFRIGDGLIHLGMLGDGLVATLKSDTTVLSLWEDKSNGFSNITTALSPNVLPKEWRYLSLPEEECIGVLLCTDGVADDLDNVDGFVSNFIEAHCSIAGMSANRRIREMLDKWPTPKHSDDKTIACLYREDISNA